MEELRLKETQRDLLEQERARQREAERKQKEEERK
jgi:hypothetical protein